MPRHKKTQLLKTGAALLCAGLFYGYVLIPAGIWIRCPFRQITGLRCPGCGITAMCLSILRGNFAEAPAYNWGLTLTAPVLLWLGLHHLRGGSRRTENIAAVVLLAFLLSWGVYRNLQGI